MNYPFKNLVFEGGGIKGIGYVGALEYLENDKKILSNIQRFGGTSAGAITALILGLGYSVKDLTEKLKKVQFEKFKDDDGIIIDTFRLLAGGYGRYKGDEFLKWIKEDIIKPRMEEWVQKGIIKEEMKDKDLTFEEIVKITGKEVYFQGTNVSTRQIVTFSHETTPDMSVAEAVRISISIPFFFEPIVWKGEYFVDGGVLNNYPVRLFDQKKYVLDEKHYEVTSYYERAAEFLETIPAERVSANLEDVQVYNKETLGFRLDSKAEIDVMRNIAAPVSHEIDNFFDFTWNLMGTIVKGQDSMHLHKDDTVRTIYINTVGVTAIDFNISEEKQLELIASGKQAAEEFFKTYDDPNNQSINKVIPSV
ncbi:patatin-like phospholipase family protein [Bacillus wiedmannii]|uniref:patatin-like phospholipase family protein n=1 Tax=Bacillus wiedmannii TaxID=1890302 RepID=UPI000BF505AE|nr:patatin-like phospholipase family protein [Bacillus wiedmannii]MEE3949679.1 patatin-like phospholipase family protein [Bacillus wiedmannii]PFZ95551.1 patatin [Bacillus wiedmannii]